MHKCKFNDPICLKHPRMFGCICGKGGSSLPEPVTPQQNVVNKNYYIQPGQMIATQGEIRSFARSIKNYIDNEEAR